MRGRVYRVGHEYRDLTKRVPQDEFINWLDTDGHTIGTTGGIRAKKYIRPAMYKCMNGVPSSLVLVTTHVSQQYHNPWEDIVDYSTGRIYYWGDAKYDRARREKRHNEFMGNRALERIHDQILEQKLHEVPPILHFAKGKKGTVKFSGLCALDRLETTWYEDKGRPIKNFRCHLSILDAETIDLDWLHARASASSPADLDQSMKVAPESWLDYVSGRTKRLLLCKGPVNPVAPQSAARS